ncbi:hypothetical protein SAG0136_07975 [Streptococcus agalactiae LMG 14747]|uniref:Uncharacterized protein n=1 Tax=Streptococcus agalactiae LMG 14747 TaxID=1154860 RepID=V6Z340_STRAG|nr:hypothetical protein SAG0136_07975 [Streptococcus agalactiae LMG 14747]
MRRTHKQLNLTLLIPLCILSLMVVTIYTVNENKKLEKQNKELTQRVDRLPEAFGGVGYISDKTETYIEVVGYGRFLITGAESQFLDKGDLVPQYILERGIQ